MDSECKNKKINSSSIKKSLELSWAVKNVGQNEKFKVWIRTLLGSMKTLPEIIKTIDKIIELKASTISFMSDIYSNSTYDQAEQIIDLSERKNSVLNIYLMLQNLISETTEASQEFLNKKFLNSYTVDELANEYGISPRSIYRKTEKIIEQLCKKCLSKNWSLKFIETQVKSEEWLISKFNKNLVDYVKSVGMEYEAKEA